MKLTKTVQKLSKNSRSDQGGWSHHRPPLPEYTTDNNNNLAKKLKDDRHKDGVAYAVQTTMCVSWTPINGRLLSAGFKHTAECSHLRLQKGWPEMVSGNFIAVSGRSVLQRYSAWSQGEGGRRKGLASWTQCRISTIILQSYQLSTAGSWFQRSDIYRCSWILMMVTRWSSYYTMKQLHHTLSWCGMTVQQCRVHCTFNIDIDSNHFQELTTLIYSLPDRVGKNCDLKK